MTTENKYAIHMKNIIKRQCRACRTVKDREELIKITLSGGELFINPNSKITGRSVYVCKNKNCIQALIKTKGIKRGLKFNDDKKIKEIEQLISAQGSTEYPADTLH